MPRLRLTGAFGTRLLAAAAAGALLAAARPPLDLGPLALVALVPLLWAWRGARPRVAAGTGFVAGAVYYGLLCSWIWYFGTVAIVPFAAVMAGYWAAVGATVAWLGRYRLRSPWLTAAVWVVGEAVLARWPVGGFSWGEVGYALHDFAAARDLASAGGVPLVSFLVVAANGLVLDLLFARGATRPARARRSAFAGLALVVVVPAVLPVVRAEPEPTGTLRVALLQGNDRNRDLTDEEQRDRYLPERHFELAADLDGRYDLVVFPESSMDEDPRVDPYLEERLAATARRLDATVLANAVADLPDGRGENLNLVYAPDGRLTGTYAKRHLVPYGEWVPFRQYLGFIDELDQVPRDWRPGSNPGMFDIDGHRAATVICFESAFGHEIRPLVRDGAEVIVVSTNNRSYRRSANSEQHLALSRMRAAETGRPVIHASISGRTAIIDADGDVHHRTGLFDRTSVIAEVTTTTGQTLYVRFGEWVVIGAVATLIASVVVAFRRRSLDSRTVENDPTTDAPADRDPEPAATPAGSGAGT